MNTQLTKAQLRMQMRAVLKNLPISEREQQSRELCTTLQNWPKLTNFSCIAVFLPFSTEVALLPLIETWQREGKNLFAPFLSANGEMEMGSLSAQQLLRPTSNGFGLPAREGTQKWLDPDSLVLVPGLAFTASGNRLGRGKGYYDRWLAQHRSVESVGVCFSEQVVSELPVTSRDLSVRYVLPLLCT